MTGALRIKDIGFDVMQAELMVAAPELAVPLVGLGVASGVTARPLHPQPRRLERPRPDRAPPALWMAALIKHEENELGRKLTDAERRTVYTDATAVERSRQSHFQDSPTYGGRNSPSQIDADAQLD